MTQPPPWPPQINVPPPNLRRIIHIPTGMIIPMTGYSTPRELQIPRGPSLPAGDPGPTIPTPAPSIMSNRPCPGVPPTSVPMKIMQHPGYHPIGHIASIGASTPLQNLQHRGNPVIPLHPPYGSIQ